MKKFAFIVVTSLLAAGVNAGVAEKKAQQAANDKIASTLSSMKTACGNSSIDVVVAWDQVDAMITKNSALIAEKNSKAEWIYAEVGDRTSATLEALGKICTDDADYKEEIAKLTKVSVTPKEKYDDTASAFALEGTTLNVQNGFYMSRSASDFVEPLKALY